VEGKNMKLKLVLLAIFLVSGPPLSSLGEQQKHAHTVAQCRADAAAWNTEEETAPKDKDIGYQLSFGELLKRQREVMDCMMMDSQHGPDGTVIGVRTSYKTMYHMYGTAMMLRYSHFLDRHQLMEKFIEEDEKGLR
jgi:hypothetical protein